MGIICNNEKNKLDEGLANLEVFKKEEYVPFAVATLRAMYQEWAKNHPDKAKPEPNEESPSEMLAYAKELLGYKNALVRARSKEIGKASTNSASAYHSLTKAYGNATTIRQRASTIAYMFTEEAEKIRDEYNSKNTKQITTLDVIQGFKDSRGKPWAGELQVFQRVYDRLMKEYLFTSDPHKKEEYKKIIDNWGAFGMLSRVILRRTEGVKLGAFNDYALRAELEEAEGIIEAYEDLDIEESHKESWMEHKDRVSGFASLGLEVRSVISKIPSELRSGDVWVEDKDDLGFPIMVDPMYAHNALANLFRGMTDSNRMMDLLRIEASKENHVCSIWFAEISVPVHFAPYAYKLRGRTPVPVPMSSTFCPFMHNPRSSIF